MKLSSAVLAVSSLLFPGSLALAALPPVSPGETVLFSEDFEDNRNAWNAVGLVGKTGRRASGEAMIIDSEWTPSMSDSLAVLSTAVLKTPPSLKNGTLCIYIAVRVKDAEGTDGNRFAVTLSEPAAIRTFIRLVIRPATVGFIEYRDAQKEGKSVAIKSTKATIQKSFGPQSFKLVVTPGAAGTGTSTAEAFYYDTKSERYVSLGKAEEEIWFQTGEFTTLSITNRNGVNGEVWFDSVVVTQLKPKP